MSGNLRKVQVPPLFERIQYFVSSQKVGETFEVLTGFTLVATSCQDFGSLVPRIIEMIQYFCVLVLRIACDLPID